MAIFWDMMTYSKGLKAKVSDKDSVKKGKRRNGGDALSGRLPAPLAYGNIWEHYC